MILLLNIFAIMNRKQNSLMRFSHTERLAQLSKQEIVIERKKKEIQAKIEAQKKKETEEALRKIEASNEVKRNKPNYSKKLSSYRDNYARNEKDKSHDLETKECLTNAFTNDGSFLDQFKKLSKAGLAPNNFDVQTLAGGTKSKNFHNNDIKEEPEINKDLSRSPNVHLSSMQTKTLLSVTNTNKKFMESNIPIQIPPPGIVQLIPQNNSNSLNQNLLHTSTPILSTDSASKYPSNNFQLKAISSDLLTSSVASKPEILSNTNSKTGVDSKQLNLSQASFSTVAQKLNQPQTQTPFLPFKNNSQKPKPHVDSISMTFKNNNVKKLELKSNPLEDDDDEDEIDNNNDNIGGYSSKVNNDNDNYHVGSSAYSRNMKEKEERVDVLKIKKDLCFKNAESSFTKYASTSQSKELSSISPAFDNEEEDKNEGKNHRLAQMVAKFGDDFEGTLRQRNENDPDLKFLLHKNSAEYLNFRQLVQKYRSELNEKNENSGFENISSVQTLPGKKKNLENLSIMQSQRESHHQDSSDDETLSLSNWNKSKPGKFDNTSMDFKDDPTSVEQNPYYKMPEINSQESGLLPKNEFSETDTTQACDKAFEDGEKSNVEERRKRKRKSRWGDVVATTSNIQPPILVTNLNLQTSTSGKLPTPKTNLLSQLTRSDPGLMQYARQTFGSTNLSEEDWKKAEDHYKINLLYQDLVKKRAEISKLEKAGKFKYEYDSDEDVEGGTWEHKLRQQEMMATQLWAEELTRQAAGKHHIGDFLPPEELERFMERYNAVKEGREPDLSDYKEFKLKEDNVGYRLLQKMGWNEGQGLGQDGSGITHPVNKATTRHENQGLGVERPDGLEPGDDEYDAYRKRMMLAYRFRPNPLNNPRRPYY